MMATAAKVTIAEVEQLVEVGELDADAIHTPSIYVKRIFQGELYERRIERRTVQESGLQVRLVAVGSERSLHASLREDPVRTYDD